MCKSLVLLDEAGRQNWVSRVLHLLFQYWFGYVWIAQEFGNDNIFINQFITRIAGRLKQNWHSDINESPRCDSYEEFKSHNVEKYLTLSMPFYLRKAFAGFRSTSHKLAIASSVIMAIIELIEYVHFVLINSITDM